MKKIFIVYLLLFLYSCGNNTNEWSSEIKKGFLDACVLEAVKGEGINELTAYSYCDCCVVELQKIYDEKSFSVETMKIEMGLETSEKFNNDMAETVLVCAERVFEN